MTGGRQAKRCLGHLAAQSDAAADRLKGGTFVE